jgi:hypothetical protein
MAGEREVEVLAGDWFTRFLGSTLELQSPP